MTRIFAGAALLISFSSAGETPHLYKLIDIGTLGGTSSRASAINNQGWVVGESETASGRIHAFIWKSDTGMRDLGTLGGRSSYAHGINDPGTVVGESLTADDKTAAFVWNETKNIQPLSTKEYTGYSVAFAVNNLDQIVGTVETENQSHAVVWEAGSMRILRRLPGDGYVQPLDVNDQGDVVGQIQTIAGDLETAASHAFYFRRGINAENLSGFKLLSHHSGSAAVAINNHGDAAGYVMANDAGVRASLFSRADDQVALNNGEALFSSVSGINDQGYMCGSVISAYTSDEAACIWYRGRMLILNDVTGKKPEWHLVKATGINDRGVITGYGFVGEREHAFVLEPVPEAHISSWPVISVEVSDMTETQDMDRILVLHARTADDSTVEQIDFFCDGVKLGTVNQAPFEWGWQGAIDEEHIFSAEMTDAQNRLVSSPAISVKPLFQ